MSRLLDGAGRGALGHFQAAFGVCYYERGSEVPLPLCRAAEPVRVLGRRGSRLHGHGCCAFSRRFVVVGARPRPPGVDEVPSGRAVNRRGVR